MLSSYLNQEAEYCPCTSADDREQPTYGVPITIPCRRQKKTQNVLSATGQIIKTQHVYYVAQAVKEGDMLDGLVIMAISEWTGFGGKTIGYKAAM